MKTQNETSGGLNARIALEIVNERIAFFQAIADKMTAEKRAAYIDKMAEHCIFLKK